MSDLHQMPLREHDLPRGPAVRAWVFRASRGWYWNYTGPDGPLRHGPFESWREAYASARRMVELL